MKLKFDSYVDSQYKQSIFFDTKTGILYDERKKPLPNQKRNVIKLKNILENHPDNDDYNKIVYFREIKEIQKAMKSVTRKRKDTKQKTKKFFDLF
jgi:hypothetical protein